MSIVVDREKIHTYDGVLLMRFTIGRKLSFGFLAIFILMGAVGSISIAKMTVMGEQAKVINNTFMPGVKLLGSIEANFLDIQRLALGLVLVKDTSEAAGLETRINTAMDELHKNQQAYEALISTDEERNLYQNFVTSGKESLDMLAPLMKAGKAIDLTTAQTIIGEMKTPLNNALDSLTKSINYLAQKSAEATDTSVQLYESGRRDGIIWSLFALAVGIVIAFILTRLIAGPMVIMAGAARRIASGDLTADEIQVGNRDEIGELAGSFNEMKRSLRSLISEVGVSAQQVAASSEELTAGSEQIRGATEQIALTMEKVAAGTEKQSRSVEENVHAINELSAGIHHIAANAESVTSAAVLAAAIASEGNLTIRKTVDQMNSINSTVGGLAQAVKGLGERSLEIGKIVEVIAGIATQTNLLALNASIEAARAGEHGSGFAVVASEVRKLAEQSRMSSGQIAQLIAAIQDETIHTARLMEAGQQEVEEGIHAVIVAGSTFERIQQSVNNVTNQIQEVSAASEQMSASTAQVVHSTDIIWDIAETTSSGTQQVSTAVEEQLASMEEITASAAALAEMSEELQSLIRRFKV
ncbi:methyl-accepting chemotaxis protein [Paenibacillus sp. sptzw28]|uniref:methyl-accepting chemotaxis protein n=1 Tax=Paenibacillus sp. sptzw28 TaxID=715179 RepID=UPI001C6ED112|nr:methyl-accepting chemotaxis protein [Paenibacillus sp. sptzw28]QYR21489.1 methyl-accepting chemotaxis protein [Paenibacillus sp. sptzw28]